MYNPSLKYSVPVCIVAIIGWFFGLLSYAFGASDLSIRSPVWQTQYSEIYRSTGAYLNMNDLLIRASGYHATPIVSASVYFYDRDNTIILQKIIGECTAGRTGVDASECIVAPSVTSIAIPSTATTLRFSVTTKAGGCFADCQPNNGAGQLYGSFTFRNKSNAVVENCRALDTSAWVGMSIGQTRYSPPYPIGGATYMNLSGVMLRISGYHATSRIDGSIYFYDDTGTEISHRSIGGCSAWVVSKDEGACNARSQIGNLLVPPSADSFRIFGSAMPGGCFADCQPYNGNGSVGGNIRLGCDTHNGIKVLGLSNIKPTPPSSDLGITGSADKLTNKTQIKKNALSLIRNTPTWNQSGKNIDGTRINGGTGYGKKLSLANSSTIIYFGGLKNETVTLSDATDMGVSGKRGVLVIGGNIYIKSNIYYKSNKDLLGIIAIQNNKWEGGNIYIDPVVTNIAASLFAEKSIIGFDGTKELGFKTTPDILANQLYIYGNIFSANTVGGAQEKSPKCPSYVAKNTCDAHVAQKYDLNYLRRYYLTGDTYPSLGGKVIGWGTCDTFGVCSWHRTTLSKMRIFTSTTDTFAKYPVIIEYNPLLRTTQPPLFGLSRTQ